LLLTYINQGVKELIFFDFRYQRTDFKLLKFGFDDGAGI